eukprot:c17216_g1_i2.p1 GENE.c17216_g1_i2~~c17216_g1_i2.p1  ORF type:complete len:176 (+),score=35.08 c17216_g1_i2:494-1021(+)
MSIRTFAEHAHVVYAAKWSPHDATVFASASGDKTLKIWDVNVPHAVQTIPGHLGEVLTCDWNKYLPNTIATGSVDRSVKIWDLRNPSRELNMFAAHDLAVRRVVFSPHSPDIFASAAYDNSVILWSMKGGIIERTKHHTEFVVGVDFNLFVPGRIASCAWDCNVVVWQQGMPVVL